LQEADQLLADHLHGRVVEDDVVELQGGFDACSRLAMVQADQRRLSQFKPGIAGIPLEHPQRCLAPHHLNRLWQAFPKHGRTQYVVPGNDLVQRGCEVVEMRAAGKGEA